MLEHLKTISSSCCSFYYKRHQKKCHDIKKDYVFPDIIYLPPPPNGPCSPDSPISTNPTIVEPVIIVPNGPDPQVRLALVTFRPPIFLKGQTLNVTVQSTSGKVFASSNFTKKEGDIGSVACFSGNICPITSGTLGTVILTVGNCSKTFTNIPIECQV